MWSVTGYDWNAKSPEAIVEKVARQVESRRKPQAEVILLHDGGHLAFGADRSHTVEATRRLLERYADKEFISISGLRSTTSAAL
jgi:peptidoglycan/xylan/chitin deacetylase (PgdA/CDA1 family)